MTTIHSIDIAHQIAALLDYTGEAADDFANLATGEGNRTTITLTARQAQSLVAAFEARTEVEPGGVVLAHVEICEVVGAAEDAAAIRKIVGDQVIKAHYEDLAASIRERSRASLDLDARSESR